MKQILALAAALIATNASAQELTPQFYTGISGGIAPSFNSDAKLWDDDNQRLSLGAFAGVNLLSGPMLYGMEIAGARDFGKISTNEYRSGSSSYPYPRFRSSSSQPGPFTPPVITTSTVPGGVASTNEITYTFEEIVARPSVVGRVGVVVQDWTFFGKAGLGISVYNSTTVRDQTASVYCDATAIETTSNGFNTQTYETGCIGPKPGPKDSEKSTFVTPNVVFGLGAEYAFDRYFARGEVEMTHVINGGSLVRANTGLGIKF